ncbi:GH39 family glycosyl hydrolase [Bacillus sp. USDA818B3_A]|uniref:GH39 family glycosyl hydrolase n=1 Tax=Bacillus sp. USDA818B3_A TaxID=2698834 RepID=UPI001F02CCF2|nr:helix-turn-helix domain-containing protein [Bacillus sp. USDA818B3_A]
MNYKSNLDHAHRDIEFIYVIKGNLQVKVNNEILPMNSSDFLLVNSNELHSLQSEKDNLFVIVHLNYSELSSLLGQKDLFFTCDSIGHSSQSDHELRNVIEEILTIYIKQNNDVYVEYLEKALKFISILKLYYLKKKEIEIGNPSVTSQNERLTEIIEYIHSNYHEHLTLEEVARLHFISVPYLSKIFKKQTGKTVSQYLNEIRLFFAVNELENSNKPITRVALDNGFPYLAAFNRVFYEYYHLKPVEYRKKLTKMVLAKEEETKESSSQEKNEAFIELDKYLSSKATDRNITMLESPDMLESQVIEIKDVQAITKYWSKLINIGYAKDILNSDLQEQISLLQQEIGFTYARVWGLFGDDMHVEDRTSNTIFYNFSNTNKLLDFLIKNNLKPFIELGPKPKIISKTLDEIFIIETISERSLEEWKNLLKTFFLHCMERYGIDEVETWYFEIWSKHIDPFTDKKQDHTVFLTDIIYEEPSQFEEYFKIFKEFKTVIKDIVPLAKVGGCGLSMELAGSKLNSLLKQWKLEEVQPDFLSVYLYPIEIDKQKNAIPIKNQQSTNPSYIKQKLHEIRKSLETIGYEELELNVTEWNVTPVNRDYLHDTSFKASYIVKNIIENLHQHPVNMLGYWLGSDIFSDFRDSKNLLHGGAGLLTKSGIKKPSYHAFALLNQLGEILVAKGENYIVTKKTGDRYQVLFFNYKHFNYSYYLQTEGSNGISGQYDIFENNEPLNLSLELQGIANGEYRLKEHKLNRDHGSILDEWMKFGAVHDLKADEVEYLRHICIPYMKVENKIIENNSIILKGMLNPHEVKLFEINLLLRDI